MGFFKNRSFLVKIIKDDPEDDTPPEEVDVVDAIKDHVKRHRIAYLLGSSAVVAGVVYFFTRSTTAVERVSEGVNAQEGLVNTASLSVSGKNHTLKNVSFILSNRQGPPSWVVRCVETDKIFTSQLSAAKEMGLPAKEISRHLNGLRDHVRGFHFERICMAA